LAHAHRKNTGVALLFLDLDYFKSVNDMLGHDVGDQLIKDVAERIKTQIRRGDTLARIGGDEFAVILEDLRASSDAAAVAQKFIDVMARAFNVGGEEAFITASIGIAVYPTCGIEAMQLTKNADAALYNAKESGRSCFRYYEPDMNRLAAERFETTTKLRHALAREEFVLHYQPIINTVTRGLTGFEALLRWNHPELGLVYPSAFVPVLEDTGLIVHVGEWVVRTACVQQAVWTAAGYGDLRMAVNVSARQFRQKNFINVIRTALQDAELDPHFLQLEITESMLVENIGSAAATLRALHTLGVRFSLDDFGTGYSSLNYLKRFPLHTLKVDRSFLENIARDNDNAAIVSAIISLGHSLRMKVVAEGVETAQQLEFLRSIGCDAIQGEYVAAPMDVEQATRWLDACALPRPSTGDTVQPVLINQRKR
jgi:diguanylate cyclase (GGDEF)-like protein